VSLFLCLAIPLALFFGFDLYKPAWLKFLIVLLPPFHVLVAHGMGNTATLLSRIGEMPARERRSVRLIVTIVLLVGFALLVFPSLENLYYDPAYARDDYRQLAMDIKDMSRPGDAIVLNAPNQWEVFTYYYPDEDVYPAPYRPGPGSAASLLEPLVDGYDRLFVLYWGDTESDPTKRIESWLAAHAYKAADRWYGNVRLATYGAASLPLEPAVSLDVRFGERILLKGFAVPDDTYAPCDVVPVSLFWEVLDAVADPYKVSVQLLDREGDLVSQMDTIPGDGLSPMRTWEPGATVVDRYGILVPGDAGGEHDSLVVVVYDAVTGQRLSPGAASETVSEALVLGEVYVGLEE